VAAVQQQRLQLRAAALHPGLGPRDRDPEPIRGLDLGQAVELGQDQRVAMLRRQPVEQGAQARRQLPLQRLQLVGRGVCAIVEIAGRPGGQLRARAASAIVVDDRVARDPVRAAQAREG
jgi:hypothetical protein